MKTPAPALLLFLAACSGYEELPRPWTTGPSADGQISEGIFVELDDLVLALAETSTEVRLVSVPVDTIRKLEAHRTGSGKTLRTVAAVAVTSAIIYAIVDSESGARSQPDDAPTPAKASR